ncbi:topoisomerase DNA-binding C4 zinc finger domain-containing protein [Patescibacteria group bacterium]|nr:topoisomerase DNA-binding C4 zinc finger domain-containing protein [Patescibacteria group bacterium]MCL5091703.1 topoisomerase DNA-binding C4 zinc finger domain-containing protein [Patescibacteria group bacterium]
MEEKTVCPKCGSPLGAVETTKTGKQLQRCSAGKWNKETRSVDGCDYVKWLVVEPETLEEKCPKCGSALLLVTTRFGRKMKRCSTNKWDPATKTSSGCDYFAWLKATVEPLEKEACPKCGAPLVLMTTAGGKRLKKCSTNTWDRQTRTAVGCDFVQWL